MAMTDTSFTLALCQCNLLVGDVEGNTRRVLEDARAAREAGARLVVFPELTLTGYPPEDLLLRAELHRRVARAVQRLQDEVKDIAVLIGVPEKAPQGLYNSAYLIDAGTIRAVYRKQRLPNYSVFDEKRYFHAGEQPCVVELDGVRIGITICEDAWAAEPVRMSAEAGAQMIVNLNASPFHQDKQALREQVMAERVRESGVPLVYVNLTGGQDELVFDGGSFVLDCQGQIILRAGAFVEGLYISRWQIGAALTPQSADIAPLPDPVASVYEALVTGVRDYVDKNGFQGAVIGLSGGIDSALTLAVAADALGAARVEAVSMPSRYTADMSVEDARAEAEALGVKFRLIAIEQPFKAFLDVLADEFAGLPVDTTEENIQARCRGVILMAISNKTGCIVLTTGNKSEMAVGYATLYGDMAGGFGVLKDVPKLLVYRLAEYRNQLSEVIPRRVIDRPPSAELAPDQKDADSLPPYEVLDPIIQRYIDREQCADEIVAAGFERDTVRRVIAMVDRNEYKRRQAAPGVRISEKAFGRDRRYPITSGFDRGRS